MPLPSFLIASTPCVFVCRARVCVCVHMGGSCQTGNTQNGDIQSRTFLMAARLMPLGERLVRMTCMCCVCVGCRSVASEGQDRKEGPFPAGAGSSSTPPNTHRHTPDEWGAHLFDQVEVRHAWWLGFGCWWLPCLCVGVDG